ncbi:WD repeat-containing protein 62 isoform X1 [Esox lucius]|uniref:WD repeat-containing protein 62 isoform X1 n=1 Tax=Esox lucius TaxID=8010 RepID=UPI001476A2F6|nr:WD repeat-containing protein 62 isoform X1 [Esox lucius]
MAEGVYGVGLNLFTSRVTKRVSNANAAPAVAANMRRKSRQTCQRRATQNRVVLERVLGITTSSSSGLACDPNTGLVAYPAGCVAVILHPKKNKQTHILNTSRKTFTALAFSQDGKYLVTGESGHMPCVRVWDVAERAQGAEVQCHKYGVACVAFSTNSSYIVSVGYQHDMTVSVWEWRKGTVIASNKVSSRVLSVSFSEDNSYFVTAGNRHIKFWYLDASKEKRVNSTVPLIGRSGLLGEQRNSTFCGLSCGRGNMASSTYCITSSGLLCQFNSSRMLEAWVDLKTASARCLSVSEAFVFCGCADGTVRVFSPQNLHYIATLHRPHCLGVDVSQGLQPGHLFSANPKAEYPDTLALTFDPVTRHLTCVYNDHSVYVWDVRDIRNVGKVYSALYHSGCVWSVETYPDMDPSLSCLPRGSFLTCSSDNTVRLWHGEPAPGPGALRNLYSQDLLRIVYVGDDTQHLQTEGERGEGGVADTKAGIRVLGISPDGQHLAAGDRNGNLHIFGLQFMDRLQKIEAHDSEVLCLEFSPTETGLCLLASASRDRLIHIFNMKRSYSLEQTVYDHSASITAIKFTGVSPEVQMVSCGADKSIYFRTAEQTAEGLNFSRSHHVVEKTTLYDMDLDATHTHTAIACQDRNIRVYNVKSGKMKKCFKGSTSDEGTLLKVQMDPSGTYLATSCSDKNICIFDYESGECVATLFGHSEIVTGMRFSQDCRHLITVSGDSCVFLWRLDSQMTNCMRKRLAEKNQRSVPKTVTSAPNNPHIIRRETFITLPLGRLSQIEDEEPMSEEEDPRTPARCDVTYDFPTLDPLAPQTNGKLPMWARKLGSVAGTTAPLATVEPLPAPLQPRGRWAEQNPLAIRSVLETHSLQLPLSPTPHRAVGTRQEDEDEEEDPYFHPQSLDSLLGEEEQEEEEEEEEEQQEEEEEEGGEKEDEDKRSGSLSLPDSEDQFGPGLSSPERSGYILYPANSTVLSTGGADGEFDQQHRRQKGWGGEELSPDSACCVGSAESQDQPQDDTDSLSQVSSAGSSGVEEEEDEDPQTLLRQHFDTMANHLSNEEKFETDLSGLQPPPSETLFLNPRLSISTRFLSRFQSRLRGPAAALRPAPLPPSITEETSSPSPDSSTASTASTQNTTQASLKQVPMNGVSESLPEDVQNTVRDVKFHSVSIKRRTSLTQLVQQSPRARPPPRSSKTKSGLHRRDTLEDVTDKTLRSQSCSQNTPAPPPSSATLNSSQPGPDKELPTRPPRQSYMGTTTSSRAKTISPTEEHAGCKNVEVRASSPDPEAKENLPPFAQPYVAPLVVTHTPGTTTSVERPAPPSGPAPGPPAPPSGPAPAPPAPPGNHSARAVLHLDLAVTSDPSPFTSASPLASRKYRRRTVDPAHHSLVTPTEMRSLGKEAKRCLSSIEDSLGPSRLHPRHGPVPPVTSTTMVPTLPLAQLTESPVKSARMGESLPHLPEAGHSPVSNSACSFPLHDDSAEETVTLQQCRQVAGQLRETVRRAVTFYNKVSRLSSGTDQQAQMSDILREALDVVQMELDLVVPSGQRTAVAGPCGPRPPEDSPGRHLRDDRTVALLERYSEMLLRLAERKMDSN